MRINLYAQNRHTLIIDGLQLSGFADGDWLQVKVDGNVAARTAGGDGPVMSVSVKNGGQITFSLMPTSPALGTIYEYIQSQRDTPSPRLFALTLLTGVNEVISATGCAWGDLPQFTTGGPVMTPRQFTVECLKVQLCTDAVEVAGAAYV